MRKIKKVSAVFLAVVCLVAAGGCSATAEYEPIAKADYPAMAPYPDEMAYVDEATGEFDSDAFSAVHEAWYDGLRVQWDQPEGYADGFGDFAKETIPQFLSGETGENRVYSPLNVYLALGMMAELTDGASRQQVLDLLGVESIEELRVKASALWNANYRDDGAVTSLLASSLWLNEQISFVPDTLETLTETYYASSYQGEMGSEAFDKAFQDWLNQQTRGLLAEQVGEMGFTEETVLALATTITFQSKWRDEFSKNNTSPGIFHAAGGDLTCDFMYQSDSRNYYWGDSFAAVAQGLDSDGAMWLILPDEGVTPEDLLEDEQMLDFLLTGSVWDNCEYLTVNLSVPKFDVTSQIELSEPMKALGVVDVFDAGAADFSPMTRDLEGEIFLSQVQHDARVAIDEEGCTAVAYTVMQYAGAAAPPEEEVDFVVDRPFLFVITGRENIPLFVGVVHQPA